jgi:hypothetical protein
MSRSLPTTLAARAHRKEGQCFFEGRTLKVEKFNNNNNNNNNKSNNNNTPQESSVSSARFSAGYNSKEPSIKKAHAQQETLMNRHNRR